MDMKTYKAEPFIEEKFGLSEGPFWEEKENVLRFVDIIGHAVCRVNLDQGPSSLKKQKYESSISLTAEVAGAEDSFLFGGKYGIGVAKKESSEMKYIQSFWSEEEKKSGKPELFRANDGAVDSKGRFWASALCDPLKTPFAPEAILFRMDLDGQFHRVITGLTIPNGLTWSKDNKIMYHTNTSEATIFAYDFDEEIGDISNKRVFFKPETGNPDGHAQDEEGNLWVALWGAWKVVKVSPTGEVVAEVRVPTRCPTAVAFAGEDIYITSEAEQEPDKYPDALKYDGGVFKCHVGIRGRPNNVARIKI